jgi:hypothetical protein
MSKVKINFAQRFWKNTALSEIYSSGIAELAQFYDSHKQNSQEIISNHRSFSEVIKVYKVVGDLNKLKYSSENERLNRMSGEGNPFSFKQTKSVELTFNPSNLVAYNLISQNANKWNKYAVNTTSTQDEGEYSKIKNKIIAGHQIRNGSIQGEISLNGRKYSEAILSYLNEKLLINADGFISHSRQKLNRIEAKDRIGRRDFFEDAGDDYEIETQGKLIRSIKIRQSDAVRTWIGDGLQILDLEVDGKYRVTANYTETEEDSINPFKHDILKKQILIFSRNGVPLGRHERDIEPNGDSFPKETSSIFSYENAQTPATIKNIFKTATEDFKKADRAPIFVGIDNSQLGFDWLTGLPNQASKGLKSAQQLVAHIGKNASLLQNDQVYLALEDCDIVTGKGRDLVILADDTRNRDVNSVPRIQDFDPKQDKVLIPVEVFRGFSANASGTIGKTAFHQGKNATNKNQRLIYDRSLGYLYHDPDGSGKATQQLIAAFTSKPSIAFGNILLG